MNILEIYNISDSVYLWYNIIVANMILLVILFIVSLIRKSFALLISTFILLLIPLGICISVILSGQSYSFEASTKKKIEDLGIVTFNKYNGSYENNDLHLYMTSSEEIGKYVEIIDNCKLDKDFLKCNLDNHSKLLNVFINKKIDLEYVYHYLNDYCEATKENSHVSINVNNVGISINYTCDSGKVLYMVDYLDKYESIEQNEKVRRPDSLILDKYDGYDTNLNSYIMKSIGFDMNVFQENVTNNKIIYTKR